MPQDHQLDQTESCAWCGNFKCCMDPTKIVRRAFKLYCNDSCASADIN